jgi:hypothetical protein
MTRDGIRDAGYGMRETGFGTDVRVPALVAVIFLAGVQLLAQTSIPAEFRGDWVPQTAACGSAVKLRVAEATLTLVNGADSQSWGNVGVPTSFFGPDYNGISVVALPDFDASQPFTVYFNADEKKGVTKVNIYTEIPGPTNPQLAKIQAAAKKLATRFPLNDVPLKKCQAP